jgi:hypothetical protein
MLELRLPDLESAALARIQAARSPQDPEQVTVAGITLLSNVAFRVTQ